TLTAMCRPLAHPPQVGAGNLRRIESQVTRNLLHESSRIDERREARELLGLDGPQVRSREFGVVGDLLELDAERFAHLGQELPGKLRPGVNLSGEHLSQHRAPRSQRRVDEHVPLRGVLFVLGKYRDFLCAPSEWI